MTDAQDPDPDRATLFPPRPGDFRGPYGHGRPAHRPDPNATYSFAPKRITLPSRRERNDRQRGQ